ncbi:hypothetical protein DVH24_038549 [Malus domestica]|uniref:Uncharacterized protein n=1 Tax=Malus domestica TaxID=3750 RepID=A0A498KEV5_MALDO|nr:hypothetical protein DVH24_038549 [Malus domestica]
MVCPRGPPPVLSPVPFPFLLFIFIFLLLLLLFCFFFFLFRLSLSALSAPSLLCTATSTRTNPLHLREEDHHHHHLVLLSLPLVFANPENRKGSPARFLYFPVRMKTNSGAGTPISGEEPATFEAISGQTTASWPACKVSISSSRRLLQLSFLFHPISLISGESDGFRGVFRSNHGELDVVTRTHPLHLREEDHHHHHLVLLSLPLVFANPENRKGSPARFLYFPVRMKTNSGAGTPISGEEPATFEAISGQTTASWPACKVSISSSRRLLQLSFLFHPISLISGESDGFRGVFRSNHGELDVV